MTQNKTHCEVIVIGGSAGSVDVLMKIIPQLPKSFPFAVIIVVHRKPSEGEDLLLGVLQKRSLIDVVEAKSNETIDVGKVYLAPGDYHLLIEADKRFTLDFSEKIFYSRPCIDVTMQLVADVYKTKAIGILLTGANDDGAIGMKAIHDEGGCTVIQDPESAEIKTMPLAATKLFTADAILDTEEIIKVLLQLKRGESCSALLR